jgi:hypothetical protein
MIDLLIARPEITQRDVAEHFGYTEGWVSRVIRADAFRERLAVRKQELVDPAILESIDSRFERLVARSLEVLQEKLRIENNPIPDLALKAIDVGARALGYGAKAGATQVTAQFVVAMPQKAADSDSWLAGLKIETLQAGH